MGSKMREIRKAVEGQGRPAGIQTKEIRVTDWIDPVGEDAAARRWQVLALLEWWEAMRRQNVWYKRLARWFVYLLYRLPKQRDKAPAWCRRETDPLRIFYVLKYGRDMELAGVTEPQPEESSDG